MKKILMTLSSIDRVMQRVEAFVLILSISAIALNTIVNVVARYVLHHSLFFSEELNEFLMIAVTFVGLSYITRLGRHIRMSALYDLLPRQPKKYLMLLICLTTAGVMLILAYYAYEYVLTLAQREKVSPALRVPVYLTLIFLPLGFLLTALQYLLAFIQNLVQEEVYLSYRALDCYVEDEFGDDDETTNNHIVEEREAIK